MPNTPSLSRRGLVRATGFAVAALAIAAATLTGCAPAASESAATGAAGVATDSFPIAVDHALGTTTVPEEPKRVVVVGLTEQDILLELGIVPVATTEWYGKQPSAVWPWAQALLGGATPTVLSDSDGIQYEQIVALDPDLIIGTNAGLNDEKYGKLSEIAPTIAHGVGLASFFSDWKSQVTLVAKAVGQSAAGAALITSVGDAYAAAAAAHPEFAGKTATFSQGAPDSDGNLWVYPPGLNTDFLTSLGFTMKTGFEQHVPKPDSQALISAENVGLIDADVIVFATEDQTSIAGLHGFGTLAQLSAVTGNRSVYTDATLAGAIYFLTPLSQKYLIEQLVPRLASATAGTAPQSTDA